MRLRSLKATKRSATCHSDDQKKQWFEIGRGDNQSPLKGLRPIE